MTRSSHSVHLLPKKRLGLACLQLTRLSAVVFVLAITNVACNKSNGDGSSGATGEDGCSATACTQVMDATGDNEVNPLVFAQGLAIDSTNNVFVAGADTDNVFRISSGGYVREVINAEGAGPGKILTNPQSIAVVLGVGEVSSGDIYVSGGGSNNVLKRTQLGAISEIIDALGDTAGNTLDFPTGVAVDSLDNVFVAGANSNNVFKITPDLVITEIIDFTGDRLGIGLDRPEALAVDSDNNVYVAGFDSSNVFRIDTPGTCSTGGTPCTISTIIDVTGDGAGNVLDAPGTLTVDSNDNVYVAGFSSNNVFRIATPGTCSTGGTPCTISTIIDVTGDREGNVLEAPVGLTVDSNGKIFVAGAVSNNGFLIATPGTCSTGGTPPCTISTFIDENSVESNTPPGVELDTPSSAAVDSANFFYIAGGNSSNVFRVSPSGLPRQIFDTTGDGEANVLNVGRSIVADSNDNIFVTSVRSDNVLRVTPDGVVSEVIDGTGDTGGRLDSPFSLAVDSDDNVYVAGLDSNNVLQITPTGVVTKIIDDSGIEGPPTDPDDELDSASSVIVDSNDNVYVAGFNSHNVFRIPAVGDVITEIIRNSGDGTGDNTGDNELLSPNSLAFDSSDNIFVSGANSHNVFKITPLGVITEIIDATGDGAGIALVRPEALAVDSDDNVYVAGFNSHNVFKITPLGEITVIIDATGDGAGNVLEAPTALTVDSNDNVYIAGIDSDNVFQVTPLGVITEIIDALGDDAGNEMIRPGGLAVDSENNIYVSGQVSDNVIKITPAPVGP